MFLYFIFLLMLSLSFSTSWFKTMRTFYFPSSLSSSPPCLLSNLPFLGCPMGQPSLSGRSMTLDPYMWVSLLILTLLPSLWQLLNHPWRPYSNARHFLCDTFSDSFLTAHPVPLGREHSPCTPSHYNIHHIALWWHFGETELLKIRHGAFIIFVFLRLSIMSGTYAKLLLLKDAQVLCFSHSEPKFCK